MIYFVHIPKTAGISLQRMFQYNFSKEAVAYVYDPPNGISLSTLYNMSQKERETFEIIYGHFPYGIHHILKKEGKYATVLRNPAQRLVSNFLHHLRAGLAKNDETLYNYFCSKKPRDMDNYMVRLLSGAAFDAKFGMISKQDLIIAQRNLEMHFVTFGLMEHLDESIARICTTLGLEPIQVGHENARPVNVDTPKIENWEIEAVLKHNVWDCRLYAFAERLFALNRSTRATVMTGYAASQPDQQSVDQVRNMVAALYTGLLLRPPDTPGLEQHVTAVKNGQMTFESVIETFLRSVEFKSKFGAFVERYGGQDGTRFISDSSQYGEIDLLIKEMVNSSVHYRIVVDVGVHGRKGSNSYDLLRYFGWKGLLIEANPRLQESIAAEFSGLDTTFVGTAVSDQAGMAELFLGVNDAVSSLNEGATAAWGPVHETIRVPVRRLSEILLQHAVPYDFGLLSIDIEGEDIKVMNDTIDHSEYRPVWVIIEASYDFRTKSLNDLPFSQKVVDNYEIFSQTRANLLLKRRVPPQIG
jgi:FkbM family methyltransferase